MHEHLRTRHLGQTLLRGLLHGPTTIAFAVAVLSSIPALPAWADPCNGLVYTSDSFLDQVSVIETKTNEVIATIPVGDAPINPTITPKGKHVYVANSDGGTISVIDVKTNTVVDTIPAGGDHPSGLAFTPDGKQLVVSLLGEATSDPGFLRVLTLATGEMSPLIPVGAQPERIAMTPDGDRVYVSNLVSDTVSVVDLEAQVVIAQIPMGNLPFNLLISPDGDKVYVGVVFSNYVAVIDTETNTIVDTIPTPTPNGMSFSKHHDSIFVTNVFAGLISEISLAQGAVIKSVPAGMAPGFIRVTLNGKRAYFTRPYGTDVAVIDTATLAQVDSVETGGSTSLAICKSP